MQVGPDNPQLIDEKKDASDPTALLCSECERVRSSVLINVQDTEDNAADDIRNHKEQPQPDSIGQTLQNVNKLVKI